MFVCRETSGLLGMLLCDTIRRLFVLFAVHVSNGFLQVHVVCTFVHTCTQWNLHIKDTLGQAIVVFIRGVSSYQRLIIH